MSTVGLPGSLSYQGPISGRISKLRKTLFESLKMKSYLLIASILTLFATSSFAQANINATGTSHGTDVNAKAPAPVKTGPKKAPARKLKANAGDGGNGASSFTPHQKQ
jgi:hypothetical protein